MLTIQHVIKLLASGKSLSEPEIAFFVEALLDDTKQGDTEQVTDGQIGAFLMAMSARAPTVDELVGATHALRSKMLSVTLPPAGNGRLIVDTCGTGGSGLPTFSTSTAAALLAASCGQPIAKHGNRGLSGRTGSADVLEALGIRIELPVDQIIACFRETNFCFLFAPHHHQATRRVQGIRRELGIRTLFNFLGPLANPANIEAQLLGVSDSRLLQPMAESLRRLGLTRAMVVRGADGLDEFTLTDATDVFELKHGKLNQYRCTPADLVMAKVKPEDITGGTPAESAAYIHEIFAGQGGARQDLVVANAGATLYLGGTATTLQHGVLLARKAISEGAPAETLQKVLRMTNQSPA